jgi:catechol 2,3-dioxygenase-like lactoylglutathione lyase family enzyme
VEAVMPALVPELIVTDLEASEAFWCDLVGFRVKYDRPEEKFAYLELGDAHVMLEQRMQGQRHWITGDLALPLGRGINFQIEVGSIAVALDRLSHAKWPLYLEPEDQWYRKGQILLGNRQFLVQDPDGYLLQLFQSLGQVATQ